MTQKRARPRGRAARPAGARPRAIGAPGAKPRSRYHHGDLRRALIDEAVRTIQVQGVEALTLRAVAQTIGVSRTAMYRHFADKAALLAAVAGEGFGTLRRALTDAWERAGHGRRGFDEMGVAYVMFAVDHPSYYRVMFGGYVATGVNDAQLASEGAGAFQVLVDALVEQQQHGLVRSDDPQQLALFIWSLVHGVAMLAIDGQLQHREVDTEALARYAVDRLRTGIAVAP
jgi:AcrR family transcriptional regulator